uniref:toxic anion resistance protein n=1 Tax=Staphylococcus epidermidis TaxID=1282 RepID=UPI001642DA1F
NPSVLNKNTIQTPPQNDRRILHIQTLNTTQNHIIQTIQQTLQIQQHPTHKPQLPHNQLNQLQQHFKHHLLPIPK